MKKEAENIMYCPIPKAMELNQGYINAQEEFIQQINKEVIISKIYSSFDKFFFFHKRKKYYRDLIKKVQIDSQDVLMAHSTFTDGYVAYKNNKKNGNDYVVFLQNSDINFFFKKMKFLRKLGLKILLNSKKIIVASPAVLDYFCNHYVPLEKIDLIKEKTVCIPFGINEEYLRQKYQPHTKNHPIKMISVGNIDENKNHILLAKAIEELNKKGFSIELNIAGKICAEDIFSKLKNMSFVHYLGILNSSQLITEYRNNDIFALVSHYETFGLVYAEALSQGLPLLYSKYQGFDQQFADGVIGYSANSRDISDIMNAVEKIIINYDELTKNTIDVVDKFDWSNIAKQYYEAIIE